MKQKIGAWLDAKMHLLRIWLVKNDFIVERERDFPLFSAEKMVFGYPTVRDYDSNDSFISWRTEATRKELVGLAEWWEVQFGLKEDELAAVTRRWESAARMSNAYGMGRMKIIENLDRFGMSLGSDNEIIVRGPKMTPPVYKNGVMIKPAQMVPILAKGLKHDEPPPYDGDLLPVICWYRLIPDDKIKGQINEEFSHYEDAEMVLQDPKNRKNKKMIIKLPSGGVDKTNVPPPRGGTKFSGKWVWKLKYRTNELSPKILEEV